MLGCLPACSDNPDVNGEPAAGSAGTLPGGTGGASESGRGGGAGMSAAGRGGSTGSGGNATSGTPNTAGSAGRTASTAGAAGRPGMSGSGSGGAMTGEGGAPDPPGGDTGASPYEIECHGDTLMCGDPTSLLCLGLRADTEVFGYGCSNECESDADCSTLPASGTAAAGCVDFVNKKYCLLVCKNGDEQTSCPSGMDCYVYEGASIGYCLWR